MGPPTWNPHWRRAKTDQGSWARGVARGKRIGCGRGRRRTAPVQIIAARSRHDVHRSGPREAGREIEIYRLNLELLNNFLGRVLRRAAGERIVNRTSIEGIARVVRATPRGLRRRTAAKRIRPEVRRSHRAQEQPAGGTRDHSAADSQSRIERPRHRRRAIRTAFPAGRLEPRRPVREHQRPTGSQHASLRQSARQTRFGVLKAFCLYP